MTKYSNFDFKISKALDSYDYETALFLAERYVAFSGGDTEAVFLLAKTHAAMNDWNAVSCVLSSTASVHLPSLHLLAVCYHRLNKLQMAETVLRQLVALNGSQTRSSVEWPSIYSLLGSICLQASRTNQAFEAFTTALELDPFNWAAFKGLCDIGQPPVSATLFDGPKMFKAWQRPVNAEKLVMNDSHKKPMDFNTLKPLKQTTATEGRTVARRTIQRPDSSSHVSQRPLTAVNRKRTRDGHLTQAVQTSTASVSTIPEYFIDMCNTFRLIGSCYAALSLYHCKSALNWLNLLSAQPDQFNTAFVQTMVARAHFESMDFQQAEQAFTKVRQLQSYRLDYMDMYGTCLWHLKKQVQLSYLGKELQETYRLAPQTWCVIGNFFSLIQEHDSAIRSFERAIQLDPKFGYAYTLIAHEYLINEDLDRAATYFRHAYRINKRHYNALYGLGLIYEKQEKYALAEFHVRKTLEINSSHPVLLSFIGSVLEKDADRLEEALDVYKRAEKIAPNHAMFKFNKARVLFAMERFDEALVELQQLCENTKPDSQVHFLMGKIFKQLNDPKSAIISFTMAHDYSTSGKTSNLIKDAIEKIHVDIDNVVSNDPFTNATSPQA